MSLLGLLFLLASPPAAAPVQPAAVEIELKKGSPEEVRTRDQLQRLLREHDLERWIFTRKIVIDGSELRGLRVPRLVIAALKAFLDGGWPAGSA